MFCMYVYVRQCMNEFGDAADTCPTMHQLIQRCYCEMHSFVPDSVGALSIPSLFESVELAEKWKEGEWPRIQVSGPRGILHTKMWDP